ncbi:ABC transporter permease [Rarobacter faecitabidus]|uniref:ABC-2 type transport system permease protein n=1 Tax=Rarobacter faecitabidus TaxID=13243 RepID=A0A542ZVA6_RARFA|nr:ABC transporter permease [Rarobacter faecitabidus]TQL64294.1 ABC-2 type transport system permease protein [Rarobacter faecitabidus]
MSLAAETLTDPKKVAARRAWLRRAAAQSAFEARMILRNGEQLMVTIIFPVVILVLLAKTSIIEIDTQGAATIDVIAPGVLAVAIMTTSFTSQAIATAFDRRNGVLRLMATTPLGKSGLLAGKFCGVIAVEIVQVAIIVPVAVALGWRPELGGIPAALGIVALGTISFTALAMLTAGVLRAEAVLAVANLVLAGLVVGGGVLAPAENLPGPLKHIALLLPSGALGDGLRGAFQHGAVPAFSVVILLAWSAAIGWGVNRLFKWQ